MARFGYTMLVAAAKSSIILFYLKTLIPAVSAVSLVIRITLSAFSNHGTAFLHKLLSELRSCQEWEPPFRPSSLAVVFDCAPRTQHDRELLDEVIRRCTLQLLLRTSLPEAYQLASSVVPALQVTRGLPIFLKEKYSTDTRNVHSTSRIQHRALL